MPKSTYNYKDYIRQPTHNYRLDTTRLFASTDVFRQTIEDLAEPFKSQGVTKVAALDALGFTLGGGVAYALGAGLVHVRKEGKLSWNVETHAFRDYSRTDKTFEVVNDAIEASDNVLVVDD